jgi:lysophospholipase L1-like esterase
VCPCLRAFEENILLFKAFSLAGWALAVILGLALLRAYQLEAVCIVPPQYAPVPYSPSSSNTAIKVEEIGDSITYGSDEKLSIDRNWVACSGGYRKPLYKWMESHGYRPVGNVIAGDTPDWDWHCEGHPGATTADLATRYPIFDQGIRPDVALIMIGTNDFGNHIPLKRSMANMACVWSEIYRQNPRCDLYVSSLIPLHGYGIVKPINASIASQVATWRLSGYRIHFVDMYDVAHLNLATDIAPSGVHPTESGYEKIARVWISILSERSKKEG